MATMRQSKKRLMEWLSGDDWQDYLDDIAAEGSSSLGPLFSFLSRQPELMHRAARALGRTVARMWEQDKESARNVIRRYMWQMNEESGNIGWGIPAAFAETLVACPELTKDYGPILNTYIMDLGFDDNYCDHDALRRTCYWAIGRVGREYPDLAGKVRPWLVKGLEDTDSVCRGMAAWALGQLPPDLMAAPALRRLIASNNEDKCEVFEDNQLQEKSVVELAREALRADAGPA